MGIIIIIYGSFLGHVNARRKQEEGSYQAGLWKG